MYFDIFLLSAIVVTAYLGPVILRRQPPGHRAFGWLLVADGTLAVVAMAGRKAEGAGGIADLLGFVAVAAAVCLVIVPPILRDLAARALRADRPGVALRLVALWDHLQPGMGAGREREMIEMLIAVRAGRVDEAVALLREARDELESPAARRHLDERIVATYLSARRWRQAIDAFEASLSSHAPSPHLTVEMVWAYCEAGDLPAAGRLVRRLEDAFPGDEPLFAFLLNRARLMFLAFVGRTGAVESILGATGPLGMLPAASRHFWSGMARLHAGDRRGARASLEEAVRLSRQDRRAREFAEGILARIDEPGVAGPHGTIPEVAALADRFSAEAAASKRPTMHVVPRMAGVAWRRIPVTVSLIAVNALIFGAVTWFFGSTGDPGALVRVGANVKAWVLAGQWWRLTSSMFLHVGIVHLVLNMYGLWVLGRLVEQMFGPARMFAIYMLTGLTGAMASVLLGEPGISAGASGAVLGLLGALIAELGLHRDAYPSRWRSALLGPLLFVAAAQVVIGFFYPAIDQWAHLGGLAAGALGALLLSRKSSLGTSALVRVLALILGLLGGAALAHGAVGVWTSSYQDMLVAAGQSEHRLGGLRFRGPASWRVDGNELVDEAGLVVMSLGMENVCPPQQPAGQQPPRVGHCVSAEELGAYLAAGVEETARRMKAQPSAVPERGLVLPEPWQSSELSVTRSGLGGAEHERLIVFARIEGSVAWVGMMRVPEALAGDIQPTLAHMLTSMQRS